MPRPKKIYKSADTGKIVSKDEANEKPKETYAVTVEGKPLRDITIDDIGKPGLVEGDPDAFIGEIKSPTDVTIVKADTESVDETPLIGKYCRFTSKDKEFVGIIQSRQPLVIIEHSMLNGVHSETESDLLSLDGWTVELMSQQEVFEQLY